MADLDSLGNIEGSINDVKSAMDGTTDQLNEAAEIQRCSV